MMAGGKRPHPEASSSSRKAPKNTSLNTPNKNSTNRDEAHDEVLAMPGNKGDFTYDDYKSLVHTAFRLIGRDTYEHAELVKATVDWMKGTNFFATKTWSGWTGEKKLCELLGHTDRTASVFTTFVWVPNAKFTIPAFIMLHLIKGIKFESADLSLKLLKRHNIFRHLGRSIDLWKERPDHCEVIQIGLRPDAEPLLGIEIAHLEPILPGPATCDLSNNMLLTPYPRLPRFVTLRRQLTSEEWLALNQDWLPKLGNRHFDNAALKDKIAEQVTPETAPLIPEEYRNKLWFWFEAFDRASQSIIDVDFKASVEVGSKVEDLTQPEHPVERSLRLIEDLIGELPQMWSEVAADIKYEVNRLFAYHEAQYADSVRFKDEVMRASRKSVDVAGKQPMIQNAEEELEEDIEQVKNEV